MENVSPDGPPLRVVLAGASGWAGSALAGRRLGELLGDASVDAPMHASARAAPAHGACDVYVEYSKPKDIAIVRDNVVAALEGGAHVVVEPYVDGALLAIRKVHTLLGVARGLDRVMDL
jgi:hypothetical protein